MLSSFSYVFFTAMKVLFLWTTPVSGACLTISPYVMDVTPRSATIRWETNANFISQLCHREKFSTAWKLTPSEDFRGAHLRAVTLVDLAAETLYEYRVIASSTTSLSVCSDQSAIPFCEVVRRSLSADLSTYFKCQEEYIARRIEAGDEQWLLDSEEFEYSNTLPACNGSRTTLPPNDSAPSSPHTAVAARRPLQMQSPNCADLVFEFTTHPKIGACGKVFTSWWLGDAGEGTLNQVRVRDAAMKFLDSDWEATVALGDNAYPSGTSHEYRTKFFGYYCRQFSKVPLYPAMGNHDFYTSTAYPELAGPFFDYFVPGLPSRSAYRSSYSFKYARAHILIVDFTSWNVWTDDSFWTWVENDLRAARASSETDWILVGQHFPPYSKGSHDSDTESRLIRIRERFILLTDRYGVDVSITGHSHSYERSHLLHGHRGESSTLTADMILQRGTGNNSIFSKSHGCDWSGTVHVVTGSASKTDPVAKTTGLNSSAHDVAVISHCSVVIRIDGSSLVSTCVGANGIIVDRFTVNLRTCRLSGTTPSPVCSDHPPPGNDYTCAQQAKWGKCNEPWMDGYCCATCFQCEGCV